jgi:glycosyltransferase involved in cell wall biosynthesis
MEDCKSLKKKTLFFVVNVDWFFISHRLPLALHAIKTGYKVYLLTADTGRIKELDNSEIHFINIPFKRSGTNIIHELRCIFLLIKYYVEYKPDIIHHVSLKVALLGSLAAKMSRMKRVINAISGFGYNFTDNRNGPVQKIIKLMINIAFKGKFYFILQNPDDINMMAGLNLTESSHLVLIKGSGVDLHIFNHSEFCKKKYIQLLFPARLLKDKGIIEYIEAAKSIRSLVKGRAMFILAGDIDMENLASLSKKELMELLEKDYIEWIGYQQNMLDTYIASDIVVLPSYREGLPKSLIEAAAIGRPIITTNVSGCRECVIDSYNGFLVPVKSISDLARSMLTLIDNEELRIEFGRNSRKFAEKEFSIDSVIRATFNLYENIMH